MDGRVIEFAIQTPLDGEKIARHIAHAKALGLPEADGRPLRTLRVVAAGPSARDAPLDGPTLALNGALSTFTAKGLAPTWWAACDPQERVADFLSHTPESTTYLVASKCHPAVFEVLKGRDVRVWHIDDHPVFGRAVSSAVSVTLTAMSLMARLGWRRFEVWGWDGCFQGGAHHAGAIYDEDAPENIVTLEIGERAFCTTPTWAAEAKDAEAQLSIFDWMGIEVDIKGGGMIAALREFGRRAA